MNKQIQELAQEAGLGKDRWETTEQFEKFLENFAYLIVRKCIQVAGDNAVSPTETPDPTIGMAKLETVKAIIRHFGVKEQQG